HDLLRNIIHSKLLGETTATDDSIAKLDSGLAPEMAASLREHHDVDMSRSSISRTLRNDNWSQKATQYVAQERSLDLRDEYLY
ncbi:hypothetical protein LX32DRAFT_712630, partial [Colletotrichum zoysiae]